MSFGNIHMQHPVKGARFTIMVDLTPEILAEKGWDGLMVWNPHLMGNSKFDDLTLLAAFLKCNLRLKATAKMVGYKKEGGSIWKWINTRILRHSSRDVLELLRMLMQAGLLQTNCSKMLAKKSGPPASAAKMIAVAIIEGTIKKWGSKEVACKKLHIDLTLMEYWLSKK
jgi:hypothetical protein